MQGSKKSFFYLCFILHQALYESLLVEVPLAGFFLSKLLGQSTSAEIHHLDSLDPELCRNLLSLKTYQGDVQDLGLDFTVLNSNLGQNTVSLQGGAVVAPCVLKSRVFQNFSNNFLAFSFCCSTNNCKT